MDRANPAQFALMIRCTLQQASQQTESTTLNLVMMLTSAPLINARLIDVLLDPLWY
jgi:hypothetical protein